MPNDSEFELHLHRNPRNDDYLGLGTGLYDEQAANHKFLVRIGDFNTTAIWKDYLTHKNSLIIFAVRNNDQDISLELRNNFDKFKDWNSTTEYSLTDENNCVYLSSLGVSNDKIYAKVLNICQNPKRFSLNSTEIIEEVLINEKSLLRITQDVEIEGEIAFDVNSNSGDSVIRYPREYEDGMVSPFTFTGYEIRHTCAAYHQIPRKALKTAYLKNNHIRIDDASNYEDAPTVLLYLMMLILTSTALICILLIIIRRRKL